MRQSRASRISYKLGDQRPDTCCGGCIDTHKGIYYLGIWSLVQSILVFAESLKLIYQGVWWGFHLALFNAVYLMLSYWYYKWYKNDDIHTRRNLVKGYKLVLIQSVCLYTLLFAIIFSLPASYLPDSYVDSMGNQYDFP